MHTGHTRMTCIRVLLTFQLIGWVQTSVWLKDWMPRYSIEDKQRSNFRSQHSTGISIDDNKEINIFAHPCSSNSNGTSNWCHLDLKKRFKVESLTILNSGDCCMECLIGTKIHVGDSADSNNPVCGNITDVSQTIVTLPCKGMVGRYVSVSIPEQLENTQLCEIDVSGEEVKNQNEINLARRGKVKQSSNFNPQSVANKAVDGIKETNYHERPCSHTKQDNPAWWQLDLKKRYKVEKVVIVNRMDCCSERLKGAEIRIGKYPNNNNPVCGTITDVSHATINLFCEGMEGRYMSVIIPGREEYLTLCEVEVYGQELDHEEVADKNLASSGEAQQSSIFIHGPKMTAERAVDGIDETDIHKSPCTHTNKEYQPWWRLDLKRRFKVVTVVITNREDCCSERLKGAEIRVGDSANNNNPVCASVTDINQVITTYSCNEMEGRYVSVVIPSRAEYLTLCEVEVYGEESPRQEVSEMNLARNGEARQSSLYINGPQFTPERATDSINETDISKYPCAHTNNDTRPWWQLDLKKRYKIETVVIVNRMDEHSERLLGAEVLVGDLADNDNPVCGIITDVSQATITVSCHGMEGRYVSVIIPERADYLTLCEVEVYGKESPNQEVLEVNLARSGEAKQISDYDNVLVLTAGRAIDGIKLTDLHQGPCTHTNHEYQPWWQLDLKKRYKVKSVIIVNRGDCCSERLKGAEIRVGDSSENNNPVCGTINDISQTTNILFCNGMEGRYVSVVIPGRKEYLTLCELEVYGEESTAQEVVEMNLARSGEVQQSSTYIHGPQFTAERAIDGNKITSIHVSPCTHTNQDNPAWWRLDLKKRYNVEFVVIVNRMDKYSERLRGAEIQVGKYPHNSNQVCGTIDDISEDTITLHCNGLEGRYVSVVIPGRAEYLTLCEVEVYGKESPRQDDINLARTGKVQQSSTYGHVYTAETAIDGIKGTNILRNPCTHTNENHQPWWQLDLQKRYTVEKVVVVNRMDCCSTRLKGAEIRVGDSADNNNPVCSTITDVSQATITLFCKRMEGRYVSVVIPGRKECLTLCEVEVYGEESQNQKVVEMNLARSGEVWQSSDYMNQFIADRAVDGIKVTDLHKSPCSHTNKDNPAWWRLDLKKRYNVQSVVIVNRMDEHSDRLRGAIIRVGNFAVDNNPVCGTIHNVSEATITLSCNGMEGRYVNVVIPGRAEYLTLCEVEVYGEESTTDDANNLARSEGVSVKQSSVYPLVPPPNAQTAIDGNKETNYHRHPCAHTNKEFAPWWQLDLKKRHKIEIVVIVNRMDCCNERLLGAEIRVGDSADNNNPVCGTVTDVSQATITQLCHGMDGRYLSVVIPGRSEILQLCEVEVYGEESVHQEVLLESLEEASGAF